jgi:hypothetical protein
MAGKFTKITAEEAAKYIGMGASDLTPEKCSKQYEEAWNETNKPNPVNTTMTAIEVSQLKEDNKELQVDNKEMMSRLAAVEEALAATGGGGGGGDPMSTSSSMWYDYSSSIDNMIEPIMILAAIAGQ